MASPVDTSVKHYRSDMPGAPVLNGLAGSKIGQLDACLVTGYGLKAATALTVASGIATLTFAGGASAAWPDAVILVEGVTGPMSGLNGEQKVLTANTATVTFATALPDGTATGTVTFKIAPAGWEKVYSKTNVAAYRSLHPESTKMFLRVDDTAVQTCRVVGYETMIDVDTGFGAFPTSLQIAGGGYWAKSDVGSAAAVAWILAGDGLFFFDSPAPGSHWGMAYQNCFLRGFGEFLPKNPAGDPYLCGLNCSSTASAWNQYEGTLDGDSALRTYLARNFAGLGTAVAARRYAYTGGNTSGRDSTLGDFPSVVDGSLILSDQYVSEVPAPRGNIPGHAYCPQAKVWDSFKMFDTLVQGGKKYISISSGSNISSSNASDINTAGASFIDITGPWRV